MIFIRENLFWILIIAFFVIVFFNLARDGYYAWRFPEKLKRKYLSSVEKSPKWYPFREYYLHYYNSDNFVYFMRFLTIFLPTVWMALILLLANAF
jgi:hypothetical protein